MKLTEENKDMMERLKETVKSAAEILRAEAESPTSIYNNIADELLFRCGYAIGLIYRLASDE